MRGSTCLSPLNTCEKVRQTSSKLRKESTNVQLSRTTRTTQPRLEPIGFPQALYYSTPAEESFSLRRRGHACVTNKNSAEVFSISAAVKRVVVFFFCLCLAFDEGDVALLASKQKQCLSVSQVTFEQSPNSRYYLRWSGLSLASLIFQRVFALLR